MSENKQIPCVVLDGHVVDDGNKAHEPGETIDLSESEAKRLVKSNIVKLASTGEAGGGGSKAQGQDLDPEVDAALKVVADGNTTRAGLPKAEAIAEILGKSVTAAERDVIWQRAEARG